MKRTRQAAFVFRTWGGSRSGSGRKRAPDRVGLLPHIERPALDRSIPALVTLRAVAGLPSFRAQRAAGLIMAEIRRSSAKGFRVLHFSIQTNHLHLIVEADDGQSLSRGMQRLASRIARVVNILVRRRGSLWRDRYHRRDLSSPRQYRASLVYVLFNVRKHAHGSERVLDGLSSAIWLDHWLAPDDLLERIRRSRTGPPPVREPTAWIARQGWLRHGALRPDETPCLGSSSMRS